jgi:hypothetical protein
MSGVKSPAWVGWVRVYVPSTGVREQASRTQGTIDPAVLVGAVFL